MGLIDDNSVSYRDPSFYMQKKKAEAKIGRTLTRDEFIKDYYVSVKEDSGTVSACGTSIFDPVLCETQYAWFTRKDDTIIDPFAGGSVRGIIAVEMGRHYCGVDIRAEQIEANRKNADQCCAGEHPVWIHGDSVNIQQLACGEYDFMFTCPPYGNLEVYSDNTADISNMDDDDFDATYVEILTKTVAMLKNDRFACIVVGNYRDKKGYLRDLCGLTVMAMEKAGCKYYNDFVIVTPIGSLPIRAGKIFQASRKMGRTHQYCLCFIKGDAKKATLRLGDVELPDMEALCEQNAEE